MTFETIIDYANRRYRQDGIAMITKQHTKFIPLRNGSGKIVSCKVEEKATVDYMGRYHDRPIAFEAKHCSEDIIRLARVEDHQRQFLDEWRTPAAIAFVLVSFRFEAYYLIPWHFWSASVTARNQRSPMEVGNRNMMKASWMATGKASIRRDEIPEDLIVNTSPGVSIDYLETVQRLWKV